MQNENIDKVSQVDGIISAMLELNIYPADELNRQSLIDKKRNELSKLTSHELSDILAELAAQKQFVADFTGGNVLELYKLD